eukprot:6055828-Alexandrium_andersonii.AAC.1
MTDGDGLGALCGDERAPLAPGRSAPRAAQRGDAPDQRIAGVLKWQLVSTQAGKQPSLHCRVPKVQSAIRPRP